jgi:glutaredoxin 3
MQTVKIYTTGTCPYCIQAKQLLKQRGVTELDEIRVDMVPGERQKMMEITGRRTVPQIFIGETHVGGCDDLMALDGRGGLMPLLNNPACSPLWGRRSRTRGPRFDEPRDWLCQTAGGRPPEGAK